MAGLRPIIEFMTFSFSLVAIDQIVNNAANMRYMSGGQFAVPIVFRGSSGMAGCLAATHSHRLEAWYAQIPGLTVILPATPGRRQGAAQERHPLRRPVVFIEHEVLYHESGEVPEGEHLVPIGKADIKRPGSDVTLITYSRSLKATLAAAEKLAAEENIDAEVIDLRTIRPLDLDTLLTSVTQDPPRRDRRGRLAVLRARRRHLRPDHAGAPSTSSTRRSAAWPPRTRRSRITGRSRRRCSPRSTGSSPRSTMSCTSEVAYADYRLVDESTTTEGRLDDPRALCRILGLVQGEPTCRSKSRCRSSAPRWRPA